MLNFMLFPLFFSCKALGTKRLASEELVYDWDKKRLNVGPVRILFFSQFLILCCCFKILFWQYTRALCLPLSPFLSFLSSYIHTYCTDKWSATNIYKFRASGWDQCRSKSWSVPLLSQHKSKYSSMFAIAHDVSTSSFYTCTPWKRVTNFSNMSFIYIGDIFIGFALNDAIILP